MSDTNASTGAGGSTEGAIEDIVRIRETYERAESEGTFDQMLDFVSEDLVVLAPGMEPIRGRDVWAAKFNDWMEDAPEREYVMTYESVETLVSGDLAVDWGTATDESLDDDGRLLQRRYNYLMVYRRTDDGSWLLSRLMHNTIS